jgi:hypothetical protein
VLVFALQKLSTTTSSTEMKGKMPVVQQLGEQFQWANMVSLRLIDLPNQPTAHSTIPHNSQHTTTINPAYTILRMVAARATM